MEEGIVLTTEQKAELCNKEISDVLKKYGFILQTAHIPQLVEQPKE